MLGKTLEKLKKDGVYRTSFDLKCSILCNVGYALFLLAVGLLWNSSWFLVTSLYYGSLFLARVFVFIKIGERVEESAKIKTMRLCGYFLFFINLVVSVLMILLIYEGRPVVYHEITVITMAMYTFSSMTMAIVDYVRHAKDNDYAHVCVKVIRLISASVSLVPLTNTMLVAFSGTERLRNVVLPALCGAVAVFILACAGFMVRKANFLLRKRKNDRERK